VRAVADRIRGRSHPVFTEYGLIDALAASADSGELAQLEADDDVESVSVDAVVISSTTKTTGSAPDGALLSTLGLPASGMSGRGVGVAVIDSGIDVTGGSFTGARFFDFTSASSNPHDDYGHGTHVSGLIAGKGAAPAKADGNLYQGIAPEARIVSLKVLDAQGSGMTSTVIAALDFAVANREALRIDIINLSLGHPIYESAATDPLVQAVEAAVRAGLVVVAAAGNMGRDAETGLVGYAGILSPGNAPSAITVGAVDTSNTTTRLDDSVTSYSSRGPTWYDGLAKPDLVAPGHGLVAAAATGSLLYTQRPDLRVSAGGGPAKFLRLSGTSMATAVATGVAALVIDANRRAVHSPLTPNLVKGILEFTALPMNGIDALTQGRGSINAAGAVNLGLALDPAAPASTWWNSAGVQATTIGDDLWTWSQTVVWGNTVVWGMDDWSATVAGSTVVWGMVGGQTVVWGMNDLVWDDPSAWDDAIVWGNATRWGDPILWNGAGTWGID